MTPRSEDLTTALERARRALAILEAQAAGYTVLTIPAHLQLELEEKRREVADLEARTASPVTGGDRGPSAFDQRGPTVGTQTNIGGNVTGPVLSGNFSGPVAVGGGEAVDLRHSIGAVYKPAGPVEQHFGDRYETVSLEGFLQQLAALRQAVAAAGFAPEVTESVTADLQTVEKQARQSRPNAALLLNKLQSIAALLATADGVAGAVERLRPLAEQLLAWAPQLFR